ncbi:hypothetical protein G039_0329590 [Pseudomonas aeruginosa VRFPA01]|nr:hypothetical protein G039_0329590 [Pseudomonas aeruginosa VRFPA01]
MHRITEEPKAKCYARFSLNGFQCFNDVSSSVLALVHKYKGKLARKKGSKEGAFGDEVRYELQDVVVT